MSSNGQQSHLATIVVGVITGLLIALIAGEGRFGKLFQSQDNASEGRRVNRGDEGVAEENAPVTAQNSAPEQVPLVPRKAQQTAPQPPVDGAERSPEQQHVVSAGPISAPPVMPANPAESPSEERAFEADTYRLTVDTARMTAGKIAVTLIIRNTSSEGVYFEATDWYLVDESGNQWFPYRLSKVISNLPGFQSEKAKKGLRQMDPLQQRIYIAAGTPFRGDIVFKSSNSDIGREFTLVAFEKKPIQGREIVVRGISVEE